MEEKRAGRRKRSRRGWHCSWVSAPKRSAKIVSAQIKLWPLPGRPRISAPLICLSNETPAHREPSGSPSHTHTHTKALAHVDTNSVGNTHRHRCITHYAYTCLPLMVSLLHSNLFLLRESERECDIEPRGSSSSYEPPKLTLYLHLTSYQSVLLTPVWLICTFSSQSLLCFAFHLSNILSVTGLRLRDRKGAEKRVKWDQSQYDFCGFCAKAVVKILAFFKVINV